jgi:hypothetical protein
MKTTLLSSYLMMVGLYHLAHHSLWLNYTRGRILAYLHKTFTFDAHVTYINYTAFISKCNHIRHTAQCTQHINKQKLITFDLCHRPPILVQAARQSKIWHGYIVELILYVMRMSCWKTASKKIFIWSEYRKIVKLHSSNRQHNT